MLNLPQGLEILAVTRQEISKFMFVLNSTPVTIIHSKLDLPAPKGMCERPSCQRGKCVLSPNPSSYNCIKVMCDEV